MPLVAGPAVRVMNNFIPRRQILGRKLNLSTLTVSGDNWHWWCCELEATASFKLSTALNYPRSFTFVFSAWFAAMLSLVSADAQMPRPNAAEAPVVKIEGQEMRALGFNLLSAFKYTIFDAGSGATAEDIKAAKTKDQVPGWIRVFDGQRVALTGYMMPLTFDNGLSKKFIMMKDLNTCCYGAVPSMNDYVIVTMKDQGVSPIQDIPVRLVGTFHIDQKYEGDYLVSLFVMDGEKFHGPTK